jgi:hypothetical protein
MSYVECIFWAQNKAKDASENANFEDFTNYNKIAETWKFRLATEIQSAVQYK